MKIKIIIATNDTTEATIDPSLTRAGRLYSLIKFGLLTPEQANTARQVLDLGYQDFTEQVSLSEALTETPIFAGDASAKQAKVSLGFAP